MKLGRIERNALMTCIVLYHLVSSSHKTEPSISIRNHLIKNLLSTELSASVMSDGCHASAILAGTGMRKARNSASLLLSWHTPGETNGNYKMCLSNAWTTETGFKKFNTNIKIVVLPIPYPRLRL